MNSLSGILRAAATTALPEGAFLRRDRGDALFVTDAPRIDPRMDWALLLAGVGFCCAGSNGLLRLWPAESWLVRLEAAIPDPPNELCRSLVRFRGLSPDGEALKLFTLGMRCLDGGEGAARFDRLLRQRAAVCLRLNRSTRLPGKSGASPPPRAADNQRDGVTSPRGGGLYACALLDHELEVQHR